MAKDFLLPAVGDTMVEAEVVEWFVAVGDEVRVDQQICTIETDKSVVEMTSPFAGVVVALGGEPGDSIQVGESLISVAPSGTQTAPADALPPPASDSAPPAAPAPQEHPTGATATPTTVLSPVVRRLIDQLDIDLESVVGTGPGGRITRSDVERIATLAPPARPRAMLGARRAAQAAGIDLASVYGTGPGGAVTVSDLATAATTTAAIATATTATATADDAERGERRERMSKLRRTIAANLLRAVHEIPSFTAMVDVDISNLLDLRGRLETVTGSRPPLDALLAACLMPVLDEFPVMNARVDGDDLVFYSHVDLGVAVDTPDGLVVPVIRDARHLTVAELTAEIRRLATAGRERALSPDALTGATITLNNTGSVGLVRGTPIVPLGNTAIVSAGRTQPTVRMRNGSPVELPMLPLSCTFDHRAIDGGDAGRFLTRLTTVIEQPAILAFT